MTKTPEQMATDWIIDNRVEMLPSPCHSAFLAGYQAAKDETNLPTSAKWISVKERLPETNELCIVNTEWRGIVPATYGNESWIFDEGQGWSEKALSYASHWMPLPEPPEDEK